MLVKCNNKINVKKKYIYIFPSVNCPTACYFAQMADRKAFGKGIKKSNL